MASLTPQALVMSASSELRQATESLKQATDATPSEIIKLEKQVELKRANLLKAVQNISTSQDEQEKANPNQKSNQPPLEKVKATQQETNIEMAIDSSQYNSIKIIPKPDELNDKYSNYISLNSKIGGCQYHVFLVKRLLSMVKSEKVIYITS